MHLEGQYVIPYCGCLLLAPGGVMCLEVSNGDLDQALIRWLGRWQEDGTLDKILTTLIETADLAGLLNWERLAGDVFFPRGKGGGEEIEYGFKRKGTTTHLLIDGNGSPIAFTSTAANGDERQEVEPLLDRVEKHIGSVLAKGIIPIFEADKPRLSTSIRRYIFNLVEQIADLVHRFSLLRLQSNSTFAA